MERESYDSTQKMLDFLLATHRLECYEERPRWLGGQIEIKKELLENPMPTKKRVATKRVAKIAKAHATQLPKLEVKEPVRRGPSYKRPARGLTRYPWLIGLSVLVVAVSIFTLYIYRVGPFAPVAVKPKATVAAKPTPITPPATPAAWANSPCLKIVSQLTDTAAAPSAADFGKIVHSYKQAPTMTIDSKKIYCAGINTNRGLIVLELDPQIAPETVNNFVFLAQHQFYDGLKFHRVVPGFIIQTGDPLGTGTGGSGYKIPAEKVQSDYIAGVLAMAKLSTETLNSGSQFFITLADQTKTLQKEYNLFGHVVKGLDIVVQIQGPGDNASTKNIKPDVINHVIVAVAP